MNPFAESELVLNPDGSLYHLNLLPEYIADTILVVGDPDRVHKVTHYFDSIEFEVNKREFVTRTGVCNHKRITVLSTGIGTDNVEIVMNELDALVNIDLKTRQLKDKLRRLKIIRIGTSGSIQADIPIGSLVASVSAIGFDSLMQFYKLAQTPQEQAINQLLQQELQLGFEPYCVSGSKELLAQFGYDIIEGITVTSPGFYAPQGRQLRASTVNPALLHAMSHFRYENLKLTNMEMETAGYYAFGRMLGHEVISLNAILANRINGKFAEKAEEIIDNLIQKVIARL